VSCDWRRNVGFGVFCPPLVLFGWGWLRPCTGLATAGCWASKPRSRTTLPSLSSSPPEEHSHPNQGEKCIRGSTAQAAAQQEQRRLEYLKGRGLKEWDQNL
jgi:hypothetical protein